MGLVGGPDVEGWPGRGDLLVRHEAEAGSAVAGRRVSNWESEAGHFVKVMPTDYKRVLEAAAAARASGHDEVAAIMASTGN